MAKIIREYNSELIELDGKYMGVGVGVIQVVTLYEWYVLPVLYVLSEHLCTDMKTVYKLFSFSLKGDFYGFLEYYFGYVV